MANTSDFGLASSPNASLRFPNFNISESDKDKDYHKQWVEAVTNYSINSVYDMSYAIMNESYDFYNGTQSGEEFNFLQEAEDGEVLPAVWINFNRIKPKIDLLIGELDKRGYDIRVKAINKEAVIRKYDAKENMRVDVRLNPVAKGIEDAYNIPMGYNPKLPEDESELDMHFERWQEKAEVLMEYALKYLDKKYKWRYVRIALFRDILIAGRAFIKCEIINGMPSFRRIDPRNMIFDINSTDDFLTDSTFFGEVRYMNIADAAQFYDLTIKEVRDIYNSYKRDSRFASTNLLVDTSSGSSLAYFKWDRGELRVLVLTAYWVDYKKKKKKYSKDKFGGEHIKEVSEKKTDTEEIKSKTLKTWRHGTLLGGKILKEWGEVENQVRSIDDFYESDCPYKACIPNFVNRSSISKVDILKALQKLKNITMYNIQLAMSRAGGKGFVYDIAQIPDEWDVKTVMKYLKTSGIAFIDSKKDGIPSGYNQFGPIDQQISDGVSKYLEINNMIDREMDAISGINEARQGLVQNSSQAVGVTQSALIQSSLATESLNAEFQMFASNVWTHMAGLTRLAWKNKEKFSPIIGETGINFISNEIDLALDDYGVFIEETNPMLSDLQSFQSVVITALQSGSINFVDALKLMREKDVTRGIREFELAYNKQQEQIQEQQAAQQEAEQESSMAQTQAQSQNQQGLQESANQNRLQLGGQKSKSDVNKELVKGRIDLRGKQLQGNIDAKNNLAQSLRDDKRESKKDSEKKKTK